MDKYAIQVDWNNGEREYTVIRIVDLTPPDEEDTQPYVLTPEEQAERQRAWDNHVFGGDEY